jgi:hypothetical protein
VIVAKEEGKRRGKLESAVIDYDLQEIIGQGAETILPQASFQKSEPRTHGRKGIF